MGQAMNRLSALAGAAAILASIGPIGSEATDLRLESTLRAGRDFGIGAPTRDIHLAALTFTGGVCTNIAFQLTSGGFVFRWCTNRATVNGISYEVQKDTFESAGSLRLMKQVRLDCQNTADFQTLPSQVRRLCP
jgi:hypothetical protein